MCNIVFASMIEAFIDSRRCKITAILQAGQAMSSILLIDFQYLIKFLQICKPGARPLQV